jgi:hypothetical protein
MNGIKLLLQEMQPLSLKTNIDLMVSRKQILFTTQKLSSF